MNYYFWKDTDGRTGNSYGESKGEAKIKTEESFNNKVVEIELLKEKCESKSFYR